MNSLGNSGLFLNRVPFIVVRDDVGSTHFVGIAGVIPFDIRSVCHINSPLKYIMDYDITKIEIDKEKILKNSGIKRIFRRFVRLITLV